MKVQVKNFQAIKDVTIEGEGLIVMTGPSNRGKSSLLRAIEMAIFGAAGDAFIRDGEAFTSVGIVDTGLTLKWRKVAAGKTKPNLQTAMEINGTPYTKLGKEHSELTEPLGFREVRTRDGKTRLRPQVANQHDPMFLITETETTIAEVLKELGRADIVTEAQKKAKSDKREKESYQKVREEDKQRLSIEIDSLNWVPAKRAEFQALTISYEQALLLDTKLQKFLDLKRRWLQTAPKTIPMAPEPPDYVMAGLKLEKVRRYRSLEPKTIPDVPIAPTIDRYVLDLKAISDLKRVVKEENGILSDMLDVSKRLQQTQNEYDQLAVELKACPLCSKSLVN